MGKKKKASRRTASRKRQATASNRQGPTEQAAAYLDNIAAEIEAAIYTAALARAQKRVTGNEAACIFIKDVERSKFKGVRVLRGSSRFWCLSKKACFIAVGLVGAYVMSPLLGIPHQIPESAQYVSGAIFGFSLVAGLALEYMGY